jgi:hypothetical protein
MSSRITYDDALASLGAMFPDIERGALEAVLESHGGAMVRARARAFLSIAAEPRARCAPRHRRRAPARAPAQEPTVEQLLVLAGDPAAVAEAAREAAAAAAAARVAAEDDARRRAGGSSAAAQPSVGLGRPMPAAAAEPRWRSPLPPDFLRVPGVGLPPLPGQQQYAGAANDFGARARGRCWPRWRRERWHASMLCTTSCFPSSRRTQAPTRRRPRRRWPPTPSWRKCCR